MSLTTTIRKSVCALIGGILLITYPANLSADSNRIQESRYDNDVITDSSFAHKRIAELRAEIAHHDALYFQKATPEITDAAYDALKRELRALEQSFPAEAAAIVQSPPLADDHTDGFSKVIHHLPMLSLDKAYTEAELHAFCEKIAKALDHPTTFAVEPKIDGLSVSVLYEHGRFVRASTRGNGHEGDDITANARMIRSLPHELRATNPDGTPNAIPDLIELRGENYLSLAEFMRLNRERFADGEPQLAHPRNVAAGTIKSRDPNETAERHLDVVFYGWGACEPINAAPKTQQMLHTQLRDWGLPTLETFQVAHNFEEVWTIVQSLGQQREKLAAPTDGAVIKLDDVTSREKFGESDHAPLWAIAYKYPPERIVTQLKAITVQVGRTGLLTPVAELTPVSLGGSMIARATLHNRDQIARLDLRVGDFVFLEKAGEIIPQITGVDLTCRTATSALYIFPSVCPSCKTPVVSDQDTVAVRCPNPACPAQLQRRLLHFADKSCVAIPNLGESTINELIASGQLRQISDLYRLDKGRLLRIPGFGEKSATQLLAEIDRSRGAELWRFINGLGIPRIGPASAKTIAKHFGSLEKLAAAQQVKLPADLGVSVVDSLQEYLRSPENRTSLLALAAAVHPSISASTDEKLSGKIFVLTGKLPSISREEATRRIEAAGGIVRGSVSKNTNYVIAGDDPGEKLIKAKDLNIPVLDEAGLLNLLREGQNNSSVP